MYICLKHTAKSMLVNFMPPRTKDRGIVNFVCPVVCRVSVRTCMPVHPSVRLPVRLFVMRLRVTLSVCDYYMYVQNDGLFSV